MANALSTRASATPDGRAIVANRFHAPTHAKIMDSAKMERAFVKPAGTAICAF